MVLASPEIFRYIQWEENVSSLLFIFIYIPTIQEFHINTRVLILSTDQDFSNCSWENNLYVNSPLKSIRRMVEIYMLVIQCRI